MSTVMTRIREYLNTTALTTTREDFSRDFNSLLGDLRDSKEKFKFLQLTEFFPKSGMLFGELNYHGYVNFLGYLIKERPKDSDEVHIYDDGNFLFLLNRCIRSNRPATSNAFADEN